MKKFRNWITFAVVLAMVLSLAVGVSANTRSKPAGIYGTIRGSSYQSTSNINLLNTTTNVDKNEDDAYFAIYVEFTNLSGVTSNETRTSYEGATSFNPSFAIYFTIDTVPSYAFVSHDIHGGSVAPSGYSCYTEAPISI